MTNVQNYNWDLKEFAGKLIFLIFGMTNNWKLKIEHVGLATALDRISYPGRLIFLGNLLNSKIIRTSKFQNWPNPINPSSPWKLNNSECEKYYDWQMF